MDFELLSQLCNNDYSILSIKIETKFKCAWKCYCEKYSHSVMVAWPQYKIMLKFLRVMEIVRTNEIKKCKKKLKYLIQLKKGS